MNGSSSFLLVLLPGSVALSTEYKAERALLVEIDTSLEMETTDMQIERDGEPVDTQGGGMSTGTVHKEVHVDTVIEAREGKPTRMGRNCARDEVRAVPGIRRAVASAPD